MLPTRQGSFRLFRFAGIDVFLHWTWFIIAVYQVNRGRSYESPVWNVLEYLSLFLIVLLHEFGHALACRQVGGKAEQIILWPLGGVAYVSPPQRPGATLWSIAAGPLVNVMLVPIIGMLTLAAGSVGVSPDFYAFLRTLAIINFFLLVFNLLPIYPLDGGQIVRALLWFVIGRARSLLVAAFLGFGGVALLFLIAFLLHSIWIGILGLFVLFNSWNGLQQARVLAKVARIPRRKGFACPSCEQPPVLGPYWRCANCDNGYDAFENAGGCPNCGMRNRVIMCPECGTEHSEANWQGQ